ncbi:hypothetical protein OV079_02170 [Nannocystis pusilla]|uniref:Uncharacterized protein n=1 Tax=Nannocystis pusilla TaxID=889268 RepID=A0A9X3IUH7_9BACT|nr:hypothetical protein [Nannocystis pusilla]MCY1004391.1 hypothetical protein [Nannocystis pusilla]
MLAVYRAFAAWAEPWAARLDEDGKAPARRPIVAMIEASGVPECESKVV